MAERDPGRYWVKFDDDDGLDEWEVAEWTHNATWLVTGLGEEFSDDRFAEIGERAERRLTAAEIAGPEGLAAYDLTKPVTPLAIMQFPTQAEELSGGGGREAMSDPVPFKKRESLYQAKLFAANTGIGRFTASGTLCGHIDFRGPFKGIYPLSPDEAAALIVMLTNARADVLNHSDPLHDPRILDSREESE